MKELSIEENAKAHTELINRLEDVKDAIKKQNYGIAMDILYKPYPEFQITTSTELKESEDERIINFLIKQANSVLDSMTDDDEEVPAWKLALSWLEKQGEQKPYTSETMNEKGDFDNGFTRMLEKEQKPADKVEPKFHKGDWVAINPELRFASPLCIRDIDNNNYRVESADGNSGAPTIDYLDNHYHLWTIEDAKDGDVLVCTKYAGDIIPNIFIFKNIETKDNDVFCYCSFLEKFRTESYVANADPINTDFYPATKEQRDLLFQKMHEAGYEWDADKKELKKIEQESTWNEKVKGLNEIETYILSLVPDRPLDAIKVDAKNIRYIINKKQKSTWSEEDEEMLNLIIARLHSHPNVELEEYGKAHDWLKLLKNRVQSKQEWSQYLKIEGYENLSDYEKTFDDIADKYVRNKNQKGYNQSWYVKERAAEMLYQANKELKKKESWSEEDEDIRDNVIRDLKRLSGDTVSPNQTYQKEIQWLKSLKNRVQPQPNQGWSEEDKEVINLLLELIYEQDKMSPRIPSNEKRKRMLSWLKSLRPQNTWKPSDEQIHYLSWIANVKLGDSVVEQEVSKHLNELLEDLKKLREE